MSARAARQTAQQVVLLTGAAGGIGVELSRRLYDAGHKLWLTDVTSSALTASLQALGMDDAARVQCSELDVRDPAAWQATVDAVQARFGRIDVLINVAGVMLAGAVAHTSQRDVDLHLDINVKGTIHGTRAVVPLMLRQGSGHIVNLASLMALAPLPGFALYSASKHAVRGFSIACALELRPSGIAVSAVCPDAVQTAMLDAQLTNDEASLAFSGPRPLRADEVAALIVERVLEERPIEILLAPPGSARALFCKLVALAPGLAPLLAPIFTRLGRRAQAKRRAQPGP